MFWESKSVSEIGIGNISIKHVYEKELFFNVIVKTNGTEKIKKERKKRKKEFRPRSREMLLMVTNYFVLILVFAFTLLLYLV